jgi:hypothetical protein
MQTPPSVHPARRGFNLHLRPRRSARNAPLCRAAATYSYGRRIRAPGGELVEVVPFGDQEPLGRGAFDALDVGAAHEVDAAGGSDRLVSLRAPLLVVDILSCSDGPQDGLSVSETRQHAQQRFRAQGRLNPYDYDFMPKEAAPVAPRSAPDSPSVWVGFTRSVRRKGRKSQNAPREVTGAGPCHLSDCTTR